MRTRKTIAAGVAVALVAGAASTIGLASSAGAATVNTTTASINGSPVNQAGVVTFGGTGTDITLTAVQDGNDIDVTVSGPNGPYTAGFSGYAGNDHQLQAFVRLDGAADTRGTMFATPTSPLAVAPSSPTYANGFTITGTFANVGAGSHTVTLTDLLLNGNGASSGGHFGTPTGFDAYYNPGTTTAEINAGKDWPLAETVNVATAAIVSSTGQLAGVTDTVRRTTNVAGLGTVTSAATLSGAGWAADLDSTAFTVALCDVDGAPCDADFTTQALATNGSGDLSGTATIPADATTGQRAVKVSADGSSVLIPVKVLSAPTLTLSQTSGKAGQVVTFTGDNWNPGAFGVAFAAIPNPNGVCLLPGAPPCIGGGNSLVGPFIPGASNVVTTFTATATGTIAGSFTVTDPTTVRAFVAQKSATGGVQTNVDADNINLSATASNAPVFTYDAQAPTGSASVAPTSMAQGGTATVTLSSVADNAGAGNVSAVVTWGDGSTSNVAAGITTATHKYTKTGTFPVSVVLKDVAANASSAISAGSVTVKDVTKPVVTIKALTASAKLNKAISGKITDNVAPKSVSAKVIQKRGTAWYAFTGTKWVKKASKAKALAAAKLRTDATVGTGAWSLPLSGDTKSTLVVTYFGTDKAGNKSAVKTYSKSVTKK